MAADRSSAGNSFVFSRLTFIKLQLLFQTSADLSYVLVATVVAIVSITVLVVIYFKKDCSEYVHEKKRLNDEVNSLLPPLKTF